MAAFKVPVGPQWQDLENIKDPKIRDFRKKVNLEVDPKAEEIIAEQKGEGFPRRMPISIELVANGRVYHDKRELARGDPWSQETKFSDDDLKGKFMMNASNVFNDSKITEVIEKVDCLEEVNDINELMRLLGQPEAL